MTQTTRKMNVTQPPNLCQANAGGRGPTSVQGQERRKADVSCQGKFGRSYNLASGNSHHSATTVHPKPGSVNRGCRRGRSACAGEAAWLGSSRGHTRGACKAAMRHWVEVWGVGPWFYTDRLSVTGFNYAGRATHGQAFARRARPPRLLPADHGVSLRSFEFGASPVPTLADDDRYNAKASTAEPGRPCRGSLLFNLPLYVRLASFLWPWSRRICEPWNGQTAMCCARRPN
jgi:hypothetical protein